MRGFLGDQRLGMAGAIEQQIGAEIFCNIVRNRVDPIGYRLDDAVGKARQRHGQGIDHLALRIPFGCDRLRNLARGRHHLAAGRRADRLAIERDRKAAISLGHAGRGINALALRPTRRAAHSLLRIERDFPATSSNNSRMGPYSVFERGGQRLA